MLVCTGHQLLSRILHELALLAWYDLLITAACTSAGASHGLRRRVPLGCAVHQMSVQNKLRCWVYTSSFQLKAQGSLNTKTHRGINGICLLGCKTTIFLQAVEHR